MKLVKTPKRKTNYNSKRYQVPKLSATYNLKSNYNNFFRVHTEFYLAHQKTFSVNQLTLIVNL